MSTKKQDDLWRLEIFWYEPQGDQKERLQTCCGELLGSVNKLHFVRRELEEVIEQENFDAAYEYADYHVENYLTRLYALRERLLNAMKLLTGLNPDDLKSWDKRALAAPKFEAIAPVATRLVVELLDLIQDDIKTRNMDTHNSFFHIWLYDGSNVWEPTDVLLDANRYQVGADIEGRLRTLLRRFIEIHCERIDQIVEKTHAFTDEATGIKKEPPEIIVH